MMEPQGLAASRRFLGPCIIALGLASTVAPPTRAQVPASDAAVDTSDAALVRFLPGFENGYATVDGVRLHYVAGGEGPPLVLVPGAHHTWWGYHKVMPALARRHRVVAVDIRGMGGSDKPATGYDKRTMARDIHGLVRQLGYERVAIAGHDIGSMVAFSFAANHPEATVRLAMLEVPHPDESFYDIKMLPAPGRSAEKAGDGQPPYTWWWAFNQVRGLPERLLAGEASRVYLTWKMDYLLKDPSTFDARSRAVYIAAHSNPDAIRANNGWYQAFHQDIADSRTYPRLRMPVLGLGAAGHDGLRAALAPRADDLRMIRIENSGHYLQEEQPEAVSGALLGFLR